MASVKVNCPCGREWNVQALAQEQQSRCRNCGNVTIVPPHEVRRHQHYDTVRHESVTQTRITPVPSNLGKIVLYVILGAVGLWLFSYVAVYVMIIFMAVLLFLILFGLWVHEA